MLVGYIISAGIGNNGLTSSALGTGGCFMYLAKLYLSYNI